jgi:hypothetical protein
MWYFMLKQRGYKVYYTPCVEMIHCGSQSVNKTALKSIRDLLDALIVFSNTCDYCGSSRVTKSYVCDYELRN